MKLCPQCGMTVELADTCPYCKAALSQKDEKAFRKDYTLDLVKIVWFAVLSFVLASVSLLVWGEVLSGVSVHTLSFATIALVLSFIEFRCYGKYSRRFHNSTFWRITLISTKFSCAAVALFIAAAPIILLFA